MARYTYASKRSIGKQEIWTKAPVDKYADKKIKHSNKGNKRGRKFYCQVVKDENGYPVRTIWHFTSGDTFRLKRKKSRLRKSLANQPK